MLRLHTTRILIAALAAAVMSVGLAILLNIGRHLVMTGRFPPPGYLDAIARAIPTWSGMSLVIVLLVSPVLLLWFSASARRGLSIPWVSASAGALAGILISPVWWYVIQGSGGDDPARLRATFIKDLSWILLHAAFTGALFTFLHAFLIHRALARKAWLARDEAAP